MCGLLSFLRPRHYHPPDEYVDYDGPDQYWRLEVRLFLLRHLSLFFSPPFLLCFYSDAQKHNATLSCASLRGTVVAVNRLTHLREIPFVSLFRPPPWFRASG